MSQSRVCAKCGQEFQCEEELPQAFMTALARPIFWDVCVDLCHKCAILILSDAMHICNGIPAIPEPGEMDFFYGIRDGRHYNFWKSEELAQVHIPDALSKAKAEKAQEISDNSFEDAERYKRIRRYDHELGYLQSNIKRLRKIKDG